MTDSSLVHPWVSAAMRQVRFGVAGNFIKDWRSHLKFATMAEQLGYDSYCLFDHPNRLMDCWTLMSALAVSTQRIRLVSMVSCVYYRSVFMLARQAADVDRISDGRLIFGAGIGDDVPEFHQMGLSFDGIQRRQRAMEDTVRIVRALWRGETVSHCGSSTRVTNARLVPGPVQEPYIPVLIGGGGERTTLRQVAELADMSNFAPHEWAGSAFNVSDVVRKYGILRDFCAVVGRPYESILRSHYTPLLVLAEGPEKLARKRRTARIPDPDLSVRRVFATPEEAAQHYQVLANSGVQYFIAGIDGADEETMHLLAEAVWPAVQAGSQVA